MATTEYTCIVCPRGCRIAVTDELEVTGQGCRRGRDYAIAEHTHPVRTLTTAVAIEGSSLRRLPVQSTSGIPRELLRACIAEVDRTVVQAPVHMGDVIVADVCGTGVDVVAARNVEIAS